MLQEDLRRLAEEIASAYEERMQAMAQLKQDTADSKTQTLEFIQGLAGSRRDMAQETRTTLNQSREARKEEVETLRKATHDLLKDMAVAHKELGEKLRADLTEFTSLLNQYKADLDAAEAGRKEQAQAEIADRKGLITELREKTQGLLKDFEGFRKEMTEGLKTRLAALMKDLEEFRTELMKAETERKERTQTELKETAESLRAMLSELVKGLGQFKKDLDAAEEDRKKTHQSELGDMATELRGRLFEFRTQMASTVSGLLGELNTDRSNAAKAWREILSRVRSGGGSMSAPPITVQVKEKVRTVEEVVARPPENEERETSQEALKLEAEFADKVLDLLRGRPQGLKMVEIADELGLPNWRSLIPVIRELLEDGEVRKEDSMYFIA